MGDGNLVITREDTSDNVKIAVRGRMDSMNAAELGRVLEQLAKEGRIHIVLDMSLVEYLCSTGIRVILKAYKEAKAAGGTLGIAHPSECVRNVLGLVALNEMLIA